MQKRKKEKSPPPAGVSRAGKIIEVKDYDAWIQRIKSNEQFLRPDGNTYQYTIYSIDGKLRRSIAKEYKQLEPLKPERRRDDKGKPDFNDPHYPQALKDYEKKLSCADDVLRLRYIEEGFFKPNKIKLPGETVEERLDSLFRGVAGDIDRLYLAIARLSNLTTGDVDFFSQGFVPRS